MPLKEIILQWNYVKTIWFYCFHVESLGVSAVLILATIAPINFQSQHLNKTFVDTELQNFTKFTWVIRIFLD